MVQSTHPLRESVRASVSLFLQSSHPRNILSHIASSGRVFFFMFKICVTDLQEVFIYSSN